ncbi:hypothetical protein RIF29_42192 [Crotalaria pallida]|uniref:Uncharacterized protein n=1 Tax=Crotalaria pallida TaxID=3830 RepID=A0AAN9E747_CROPI
MCSDELVLDEPFFDTSEISDSHEHFDLFSTFDQFFGFFLVSFSIYIKYPIRELYKEEGPWKVFFVSLSHPADRSQVKTKYGFGLNTENSTNTI